MREIAPFIEGWGGLGSPGGTGGITGDDII